MHPLRGKQQWYMTGCQCKTTNFTQAQRTSGRSSTQGSTARARPEPRSGGKPWVLVSLTMEFKKLRELGLIRFSLSWLGKIPIQSIVLGVDTSSPATCATQQQLDVQLESLFFGPCWSSPTDRLRQLYQPLSRGRFSGWLPIHESFAPN